MELYLILLFHKRRPNIQIRQIIERIKGRDYEKNIWYAFSIYYALIINNLASMLSFSCFAIIFNYRKSMKYKGENLQVICLLPLCYFLAKYTL